MEPALSDESRLHALDALRAFVLVLGVAFHSALSEVFPNIGLWAVGTSDPSYPLWWFVFASHMFRMEIFFLLAGFFAFLVVSRRGVNAFLRDRALRVALVFVVLLYPIKYINSVIWIEGGLQTGWLRLGPESSTWTVDRVARYVLSQESFPKIHLNHLWFLYFLCIVSAAFVALRALALKTTLAAVFASGVDDIVDRALRSALAPLWISLPVIPLLTQMRRYDVDTPDKSFIPALSALALYGYFFVLGWWLHRRRPMFISLRDRWPALLSSAFLLSFAGWAGDHHLTAFGETPSMRAAMALINALTMCSAVLGLLGLFVRFASAPSPRIRYVADAAYWVYLVHLPIVVALQVLFAQWGSSLWRFAAVSSFSLLLCFASYHVFVRNSWIGRWLRGRPLAAKTGGLGARPETSN